MTGSAGVVLRSEPSKILGSNTHEELNLLHKTGAQHTAAWTPRTHCPPCTSTHLCLGSPTRTARLKGQDTHKLGKSCSSAREGN